jgi:hypothetical protein
MAASFSDMAPVAEGVRAGVVEGLLPRTPPRRLDRRLATHRSIDRSFTIHAASSAFTLPPGGGGTSEESGACRFARAPYTQHTHTYKYCTSTYHGKRPRLLIPRPRRPPPPCCLARVGWSAGSARILEGPASHRSSHLLQATTGEKGEFAGMDGAGRATVRGGKPNNAREAIEGHFFFGLAFPTKESACFCWTALAE